jgi:hypothetical protein
MFPPGWQGEQGPHQHQQAPDIIVPMRVVKAMEFIALMGHTAVTRC